MVSVPRFERCRVGGADWVKVGVSVLVPLGADLSQSETSAKKQQQAEEAESREDVLAKRNEELQRDQKAAQDKAKRDLELLRLNLPDRKLLKRKIKNEDIRSEIRTPEEQEHLEIHTQNRVAAAKQKAKKRKFEEQQATEAEFGEDVITKRIEELRRDQKVAQDKAKRAFELQRLKLLDREFLEDKIELIRVAESKIRTPEEEELFEEQRQNELAEARRKLAAKQKARKEHRQSDWKRWGEEAEAEKNWSDLCTENVDVDMVDNDGKMCMEMIELDDFHPRLRGKLDPDDELELIAFAIAPNAVIPHVDRPTEQEEISLIKLRAAARELHQHLRHLMFAPSVEFGNAEGVEIEFVNGELTNQRIRKLLAETKPHLEVFTNKETTQPACVETATFAQWLDFLNEWHAQQLKKSEIRTEFQLKKQRAKYFKKLNEERQSARSKLDNLKEQRDKNGVLLFRLKETERPRLKKNFNWSAPELPSHYRGEGSELLVEAVKDFEERQKHNLARASWQKDVEEAEEDFREKTEKLLHFALQEKLCELNEEKWPEELEALTRTWSAMMEKLEELKQEHYAASEELEAVRRQQEEDQEWLIKRKAEVAQMPRLTEVIDWSVVPSTSQFGRRAHSREKPDLDKDVLSKSVSDFFKERDLNKPDREKAVRDAVFKLAEKDNSLQRVKDDLILQLGKDSLFVYWRNKLH